MPYREGQKRPTLPGFLASPIVNQVIRKRLFGGAYIRFVDSFIVLYTLYMMGAVLGRARRNQFDVLVKMLTLPEANVSDYVQLLQKYAKNRLSKFVADVGKEPS